MTIKKDYKSFLENRKLNYELINGDRWEYITSGDSSNTLLFLNGGLRIADSAFKYINLFNNDYKVLVPTYPEIFNLNEILDGIISIIKKERKGELYLLCQSYGGMLGEAIIQNHPELFSKVVFCGTSPLKATRKEKFKLILRSMLINTLPERIVLKIYKKNLLKVIEYPEYEKAFWQNYLNDLFDNNLNKKSALSHFKTSIDALNNYAFDKRVNKFNGKILAIRGELDRLISELDICEIQNYYNDVKIETIKNSGHTCAFQNPVDFYNIIINFLKY